MKQEAIRKLRHRILAGILCFSIVFAGQPNGLKASGIIDANKEEEQEQTTEYVSYDGMDEDFNTDEATEIDTGDSQNVTLTEEDTPTASMPLRVFRQWRASTRPLTQPPSTN